MSALEKGDDEFQLQPSLLCLADARQALTTATMRIEVAYGTAQTQALVNLEVENGATVADVLQAVAGIPPFSELPLTSMPVGVFGRLVDRGTPLKPGDRVELYRPLSMDPKEARRRRERRVMGARPGTG